MKFLKIFAYGGLLLYMTHGFKTFTNVMKVLNVNSVSVETLIYAMEILPETSPVPWLLSISLLLALGFYSGLSELQSSKSFSAMVKDSFQKLKLRNPSFWAMLELRN